MSYSALSLFCDETRCADARAFAELMAHLALVDKNERTVLTVQVENECGEMGAAREHSPEADEAFGQAVPTDLVEALRATFDTLVPDIAEALAEGCQTGTWEEVFGPVAEELFTSYHMARYVEAVAAAGKAVYPLPMLANCWLDKGHKPGRFPTGGPVARVMEVWRHAAPSIDIICPDVYVPYFCRVCDEYRKLGNPLYIAETATYAAAAARELWAVGHHHAICFAPFGFESIGEPFDASASVLFGADASDPAMATPQDFEEYSKTTSLIGQVLSVLRSPEERSTMVAAISEVPDKTVLDLGDFRIRLMFRKDGLPGACLASRAQDGTIYLVGLRCTPIFESNDRAKPHCDIIALEDGLVEDGAWRRDRRLNGDESALIMCETPTMMRVELFAYA